jgi:predicted metalloendopeptidase
MTTFAQSKGFDTSRMDRSTDACDDFFQYANGTWLKTTEIPASEARWGTFNILADNNNSLLREVLENAVKTESPVGSDSQLIGDFYETCMNEAAINKAGAKPIEPFLKKIEKIKTIDDVSVSLRRCTTPDCQRSFHSVRDRISRIRTPSSRTPDRAGSVCQTAITTPARMRSRSRRVRSLSST